MRLLLILLIIGVIMGASDTEYGYEPGFADFLEEAEERLAKEAAEVRETAKAEIIKAQWEAKLAAVKAAEAMVETRKPPAKLELPELELPKPKKEPRDLFSIRLERVKEIEEEFLKEQQGIAERGKQTVETEIETKCREWLTIHGEPFDFETELLGGRIDLQFIPVSFIIGRSAVRFFEQNDSQKQMQKVILSSMGYKVIDKSPTRMLDIDYEMKEMMKDIYPWRRK